VTASAGIQVERELESVAIPAEDYDIQPILPEKFRDYLFTLYPDLEEEENRVSPTSLRTGENSLPAALKSGEIESFVAELRQKYEKVAGVERRIQSQVVDYLAMGGTISYDLDGAAESAADLTADDYAQLREDVPQCLVSGGSRLRIDSNNCGSRTPLCARRPEPGAEPFRYQDLVELFDVDRRTIADSYLPALAELYLLTGVTEYDNSRPPVGATLPA